MGTRAALSLLQGNDVTVSIAITQEDGVTPQNLTGLTPQMILKEGAGVPDSSGTTLTTSGGLTITSVPDGTLTAQITKAMTATAGRTWYRVDVIDGSGDRTTAVYGDLVVTAG